MRLQKIHYFRTVQQQQFVAENLRKLNGTTDLWIGLNDMMVSYHHIVFPSFLHISYEIILKVPGTWHWSRGGGLEGGFWSPGHPSNRSGHECAKLTHGGGAFLWGDEDCQEEHAALCQYQAN